MTRGENKTAYRSRRPVIVGVLEVNTGHYDSYGMRYNWNIYPPPRSPPARPPTFGPQILFRMLKEVVRFGVVIGVVLLGFAMAMFALFGGTAAVLGEDETTSSISQPDEEGTTGVLSVDPWGR